MYTAKVVEVVPEAARITYRIQYTDGTNTLVEALVADGRDTTDMLKSSVTRRLAQLNRLKSEQGLVVDQVDFTVVEKPVPPPPPPPDPPPLTAYDLWRKKVSALILLQRVVIAGGMDPTHVDFVALQTAVKAEYQRGFLDQL